MYCDTEGIVNYRTAFSSVCSALLWKWLLLTVQSHALSPFNTYHSVVFTVPLFSRASIEVLARAVRYVSFCHRT